MAQAVRFSEFGGLEVLTVVAVDPPVPGPGQVLVRMRAASINPGEDKIRSGALEFMFPTTFPTGEGSDLAGTVVSLGPDVDAFAVGDEVLGWVDTRSSHAELIAVDVTNLLPKPAGMAWEVAGSLFVAGTTAWAAVRAVDVAAGETVVVSGAGGAVGSLVVQLLQFRGARVIAVAGERDLEWLAARGALPVAYGDGVLERIRSVSDRVDALIDASGHGYVELAINDLDIDATRVNTIVDFAAAQRYGVKSDGSAEGSTAEVLAEMVALVDRGEIEVAIARTFPLAQVVEAFQYMASTRERGKVVLVS